MIDEQLRDRIKAEVPLPEGWYWNIHVSIILARNEEGAEVMWREGRIASVDSASYNEFVRGVPWPVLQAVHQAHEMVAAEDKWEHVTGVGGEYVLQEHPKKGHRWLLRGEVMAWPVHNVVVVMARELESLRAEKGQ